MKPTRLFCLFLISSFGIHAAVSFAAEAADDSRDERGLGLFKDYVEPMFKKHCFECHSHASGKAKGGLVLDSRNGLLKGGELGAALVPGKPDESLMLKALSYTDSDLEMPPKEKLDSTLIAHVREWIALGAPDPRDGPEIGGKTVASGKGPRAEDLWSLKPLKRTPVPAVKQTAWPKGDVDRFLLAAMEAKGVTPSPDAPPHIILRRLHDVLTGLPPTPEETRSFLEAAAHDLHAAMEARIDALLQSRQFGERWARHWLDLARYADVDGGIMPKPLGQSWRYRAYVIDAFHRDKPWNDFVREQVAGDLLPPSESDLPAARRIATGFLSLAHVVGVDRGGDKINLDRMDEQMDVIGKTFLGIQFGCARCHDHKIDPIPTREYYALAGIFRSTTSLVGAGDAGMKKKKAGKPGAAENSEPAAESVESAAIAPVWFRLGPQEKFGVQDAKQIRDEPIHLRGEEEVLGEVVPRALPTLLRVSTVKPIAKQSSGRLELADWLLADENPLAPRVIVNRVWQHVFGSGLVRSTDNFGLSGEAPSHPELLDELARRFREEHRGSFKSLIRELVLSHAFRQASAKRTDAVAADPENRLLWRAHVRRRDAEALVDSIRFVSGSLDLEPAASTAPAFQSGNQASTADLEIPATTLNKRAIYWPVFRKDTPVMIDILSLFDFPDATLPRGAREAQQLPSQSLALMNSPIVLNAANQLQQRLPKSDERTRLEALYERVLARKPSDEEARAALGFVEDFEKQLAAAGAAKPENAHRVAWNRLSHTLLISGEFTVLE